MAVGLSGVIKCVIFAILIPIVSAGDDNCKSYQDIDGFYQPAQTCPAFCCGSCNERYCCRDYVQRFTEDREEYCIDHGPNSSVAIGTTVAGAVVAILIIISCCVCPCCCLYNMCRKPRPVIATTTHTTVVTHTPQHYPQQPTASPGIQGPSYQGGQVQGYQSIPVQPAYGAQPMPQAYGAQPMPQAYGAQPMPQAYGAQPMPQAPYPAYTPGQPPPYQEAMGPSYGPSPMAYSQAAFTPGQPSYPPQPPGQLHPQANAPPPPADHGQPAYNPAYAHPPPKTGY